MMEAKVEEIYTKYIKNLSIGDRLRLLELTARDLVVADKKPKRSLLELEGLGADIWHGVDAQEYVNGLRSEWSHRP